MIISCQYSSTLNLGKMKSILTYWLVLRLTNFFCHSSLARLADLPKPIVAISYASPRVGDKGYLAKFKQLEKKGMLRHIRVSNEGDIVAVSPSAGFYQTGLNLHVAPGKQVEIGYCKDRSIWSQLNVSALANHGLPTYHKRLFIHRNSADINSSVEELYAKHC